jgi:hypothetical protein
MGERMLAKAILAGVLALALVSMATAEQKFRKLTGQQIRAKFSDMELTDEVHWYDFYSKNGTLLSSSMGKKRVGKWWIDKGQLCIDVDGETMVRCYEVRASGNKVELRAEGAYPLDAVLRTPIDRR